MTEVELSTERRFLEDWPSQVMTNSLRVTKGSIITVSLADYTTGYKKSDETNTLDTSHSAVRNNDTVRRMTHRRGCLSRRRASIY